MTTYETYQEAKIANPESAIVHAALMLAVNISVSEWVVSL